MKNFENSINKFNGQYLKCIVSNYTSSKNMLANSGSLIVIQPKSGKLNDIELEEAYNKGIAHRNYVYLGNEFLASGFGFGSQYILEKAENIVKRYNDDINDLINKDNELNNKIDTEVQNLLNELHKYVLTNGGHIENTIVSLNGYDIPTKDIILYGEEAKYTNMVIDNIKILVNGNECKDDVVFLPIGSTVKNIEITIDITKNDSGGINSLQVLHSIDDDEYEGTKVLYDLDTDISLDEDYGKYRIFYTKQFNNSGIVVDSFKKDILKSLYINVKGTPVSAYKYYPMIYNKYKFKIISASNAIIDNTIDVQKSVSIRPQYYIKYSENGSLTQESFINVMPLNSITDYQMSTIRIPINELMNINGRVCVAVPSNFTINKIKIIKDNINSFNWTGAVAIIKNKKMKCPNTDETNPYYINYDIYCVNASRGFYNFNNGSLYQLEASIIYNYAKYEVNKFDEDYDNLPTQNPTNTELSLNESTFEILNDEEFNNIYWINYSNSYSPNIDNLKERLNNSNINGATKI